MHKILVETGQTQQKLLISVHKEFLEIGQLQEIQKHDRQIWKQDKPTDRNKIDVTKTEQAQQIQKQDTSNRSGNKIDQIDLERGKTNRLRNMITYKTDPRYLETG